MEAKGRKEGEGERVREICVKGKRYGRIKAETRTEMRQQGRGGEGEGEIVRRRGGVAEREIVRRRGIDSEEGERGR